MDFNAEAKSPKIAPHLWSERYHGFIAYQGGIMVKRKVRGRRIIPTGRELTNGHGFRTYLDDSRWCYWSDAAASRLNGTVL